MASELWRAFAACTDTDPDIFYPISEDVRETAAGKAVCRGCMVVEDCLHHALVTHEKHGIWGGQTEGERRRYRRRKEGYTFIDTFQPTSTNVSVSLH